MPKMPLSLISLNNVCQCFLQRKKCKKDRIAQDNTPEKPAQNIVFKLTEMMAICEYWRESEDGKIPKKDDILHAYIEALQQNSEIPEKLNTLYTDAINSNPRQGRSKTTQKEMAFRSLYAAILWVIAKFEREYKSGIFQLSRREDARITFYKGALNKVPPCDEGKKSPFNMALSFAKKEANSLYDLLKNEYEECRLTRWNIDIENMEMMARKAYELLSYRREPLVTVELTEKGTQLKITWEK